jgi:hypothetical protein
MKFFKPKEFMMRIAILFFFVSILFTKDISAQKHFFKIGTQLPVQYSLAYEYKFSEKYSGIFNYGLITKPFDDAILGVMSAFGVSKPITSLVSSAFTFGQVFTLEPRYHFKSGKSYLGIYPQWITLTAENYVLLNAIDVKATSVLFNMGITYGKNFPLKNSKKKIQLEASFAKVFASDSNIYSSTVNLNFFKDYANNYLNERYLEYGYIVSLNVYYVIGF